MRISKEAETRKREIMEAAKKLFLEKGYDSTSISDIVKEVNVAKGLFYYYYPKKESLLEDIGNEYFKEINSMWKEQEGKPKNVIEDLNRYMKFHLGLIESRVKVLNMAGGEYSPFAQMIRQRLIDTAVEHVFAIFERYKDKFTPELTYPRYAVRILIVGLADLYTSGIQDEMIYFTLLMEILGIKVTPDLEKLL